MSDHGTYLAYVEKKFNKRTLELIGAANQILDEYEEKGIPMTLRQLYYQFVARGLLPNRIEEYNKLGAAVSDGRMAGLISWTSIEDRGRNLMGLNFVGSPGEILRRAMSNFRLDLWAEQPYRPEVWVEKQALEGVVGAACNELRVDYFATRGYNSQSEQWRAGQRLAGYIQKGQRPVIFHLGDHDPSGIDMTRDNQDRLSLFCGVPVMVVRLALNMDQIELYDPPPNPAKMTDSRAVDYVEKFGESSWELDALPPEVLRDLIRDAVLRLRDDQAWDRALAREAEERDLLNAVVEEFEGKGSEDVD